MVRAGTPFTSILVANRGEIACRVMRTAKAMGLRTIAVYSEADADAPHVKTADDAFLLGPAPVAESYLNAERILEAARATGAEAIHPGYGFLSENAGFARACADAGLVFIGPRPDAIDLMGDKAKAKRRMIEAGVPCVPGYQGEDQSDGALTAAAREVGFPLMVKAAAGGGGRGMRLVEREADLAGALQTARSEAENAFGSGELILERAIIEPRHVEIQVFADAHGNVIHLGERDCSVQRRHQKVLEEAPCPVMTPDLRAAMGAAAVKAARDIDYLGAGTVEFLLDADGAFYFLEMNTRLQVEHPVTEMVAGVDLVAMQIRAAQGQSLDLTQEEVALNGHAIEARLYAEDAANGFLPATGPVDLWRPARGEGVRIDAGIATGGAVSPFYDPMLAKAVAHGATREEARRRLIAALKETTLFGVVTNKGFLIDALEKPAFAGGAATTAFIAQSFSEEDLAPRELTPEDAACAALLLYLAARDAAREAALSAVAPLMNWSSATPIETPYRLAHGDAVTEIAVTPDGNGAYALRAGEKAMTGAVLAREAHEATLLIGGARRRVLFNLPADENPGARLQLSVDGRDFDLTNLNAVVASALEAAGAGAVAAPMHGALLEVFVAPGQKVAAGDRLAVLEAMKMQHELTAAVDGEIAAVHFEPGAQVPADAIVMEIAPAEPSSA